MRKVIVTALVAGCLGLTLVACGQTQPSPQSNTGDDQPLSHQLDKPASAREIQDQADHSDDNQLAILADKLAAQSSDLAAQAQQAPFGVANVPEEFSDSVSSFAALAASASKALRASGGPHDLACIYRGMSADSRATLSRLRSAKKKADQVKDYKRMVALFHDVIGVQTGKGSQKWTGETCAAEAPGK